MIIQQFIRKLNNTELNFQSTNDSYIRVSTEIQKNVPNVFFESLDSKKIKVINMGTMAKISDDKWLRYQYYPSNKEYRIVSLTEIYEAYNPFPGDFIIIEKITDDAQVYYQISLKKICKLSMKFNKSLKSFEILNLKQDNNIEYIDKDIILHYKGTEINSKITFSQARKKRTDSPTETKFYNIDNLPENITKGIGKDTFVEISQKAGKYYLSIEKSWEFNVYEK